MVSIPVFAVSLGKGSYWCINEFKTVPPDGTKSCGLVVVYLIFVFLICLPQKNDDLCSLFAADIL